MDIFEFISGINRECPGRLPGASFEAYYRTLLTSRFKYSSEANFLRHCILNFLVQQLAVRASFRAESNRYVFAGSNPEDYAVSLLGMLPVLKPVWCAPNISPENISLISDILATGLDDDQKEFSTSDKDLYEVLHTSKAESFGLIVHILPTSPDNIKALYAELQRALSPGGTALILESTSTSSIILSSDKFKVSTFGGNVAEYFGGNVNIIRRVSDC